MMPAYWFTIQVNKIRIPIFLPLALPLAIAIEIIAFIPLTIVGIVKKNTMLIRLTGFYLSRFLLAFVLYGRRFEIKVCDNNNKVRIAGNWKWFSCCKMGNAHPTSSENENCVTTQL